MSHKPCTPAVVQQLLQLLLVPTRGQRYQSNPFASNPPSFWFGLPSGPSGSPLLCLDLHPMFQPLLRQKAVFCLEAFWCGKWFILHSVVLCVTKPAHVVGYVGVLGGVNMCILWYTGF